MKWLRKFVSDYARMAGPMIAAWAALVLAWMIGRVEFPIWYLFFPYVVACSALVWESDRAEAKAKSGYADQIVQMAIGGEDTTLNIRVEHHAQGANVFGSSPSGGRS